eukprot:734583-Pelagomonas_calceolata.AAC.4
MEVMGIKGNAHIGEKFCTCNAGRFHRLHLSVFPFGTKSTAVSRLCGALTSTLTVLATDSRMTAYHQALVFSVSILTNRHAGVVAIDDLCQIKIRQEIRKTATFRAPLLPSSAL